MLVLNESPASKPGGKITDLRRQGIVRQAHHYQTGVLQTQSDELFHIYSEILEHEWPGQIVLIGASPRRIEMNDRESSIRTDGRSQRHGPIGQPVFDDAGQTGERHVVHRDVDRRAIVVDRLDAAARFRVGVRHLTNAGEYVKHAPVVFFTAAIKTRQELKGCAGNLLGTGMWSRLPQCTLRHEVPRQERLVDRQAEEIAQITGRTELRPHGAAVGENRVRVVARQNDAPAGLIRDRAERQHEIRSHVVRKRRPRHGNTDASPPEVVKVLGARRRRQHLAASG